MLSREEILEIVQRTYPEAVLYPPTGFEDPVVYIGTSAGYIYVHKYEDNVERISAAIPISKKQGVL